MQVLKIHQLVFLSEFNNTSIHIITYNGIVNNISKIGIYP